MFSVVTEIEKLSTDEINRTKWRESFSSCTYENHISNFIQQFLTEEIEHQVLVFREMKHQKMKEGIFNHFFNDLINTFISDEIKSIVDFEKSLFEQKLSQAGLANNILKSRITKTR